MTVSTTEIRQCNEGCRHYNVSHVGADSRVFFCPPQSIARALADAESCPTPRPTVHRHPICLSSSSGVLIIHDMCRVGARECSNSGPQACRPKQATCHSMLPRHGRLAAGRAYGDEPAGQPAWPSINIRPPTGKFFTLLPCD